MPDTYKQISIRLPLYLYEALRHAAFVKGTKPSLLVVKYVRAEIAREQADPTYGEQAEQAIALGNLDDNERWAADLAERQVQQAREAVFDENYDFSGLVRKPRG